MRELTQHAIEKIVSETVGRCNTAVLAYIFGSTARDRRGPLSDIDVAVYIDPLEQAGDEMGLLNDDLCRALKTDRVDLVSLTEAPPSLSYRVIRDGKCVLCRNPRIKERFESDTVMRYLDFKPVRDRMFRMSGRKIREAVI